jgi:hypothetical protein
VGAALAAGVVSSISVLPTSMTPAPVAAARWMKSLRDIPMLIRTVSVRRPFGELISGR